MDASPRFICVFGICRYRMALPPDPTRGNTMHLSSSKLFSLLVINFCNISLCGGVRGPWSICKFSFLHFSFCNRTQVLSWAFCNLEIKKWKVTIKISASVRYVKIFVTISFGNKWPRSFKRGQSGAGSGTTLMLGLHMEEIGCCTRLVLDTSHELLLLSFLGRKMALTDDGLSSLSRRLRGEMGVANLLWSCDSL